MFLSKQIYAIIPNVFCVVRRTMSAIAYQNNIRFTVVKAELPLLQGVPEPLRQMISNLISNALEFTKEGGEITVYAEEDRKFAAISVADTGEGIPLELMPHIFEKFRQGEESLKRLHYARVPRRVFASRRLCCSVTVKYATA